jgi:kinesin family protein 6/9
MVIMNLNKKAKGEDVHIPFRKSMMTMILRDSLGVNFITKMIATI